MTAVWSATPTIWMIACGDSPGGRRRRPGRPPTVMGAETSRTAPTAARPLFGARC